MQKDAINFTSTAVRRKMQSSPGTFFIVTRAVAALESVHDDLARNLLRKFAKTFGRWALAIFFIIGGANHFANPAPYLSMMPTYLPSHAALVAVSGIAEIAGGLGVLLARTRVLAGWGLIALLIAVFPANLHVAFNGWPGVDLPPWTLWLRLPLQLGFLWWVYWICLSEPEEGI